MAKQNDNKRKKKRVFVALPISKHLQEKVHAWQDAHVGLADPPADGGVRWVRGSNLHITLVPPMWVDDALGALERLVDALRQVRGKPFRLRFTRVGFGPRPQHPRLIWVYGDEKPPQEGVELKERLEQATQKKSTYKNWLPHLTIARFHPRDFKELSTEKLEKQVSWEEHFTSFVLMQSHLKRSGAEYKILYEFPFN